MPKVHDATVRATDNASAALSARLGPEGQRPGPGQDRDDADSRHSGKSASPAGQRPSGPVSGRDWPGVERRRWRQARRRFLWLASSKKKVRQCGRVRLEGDTVIRVRDGVAHYAGLRTCADVWACPCCSAKIRNVRAAEISDAAGRWDQAGRGLYLVTLTVPHDAGMPLGELWEAMTKAMQAVRGGKAYQQVKASLGIVATVTAKEVTHGQHGWHPHLHLLVFTVKPSDGEGLFDLLTYLRRSWSRQVVKAGLGVPDRLHGVRVDTCHSGADAGLYLAKTQDGRSVGNEVARGDLKSAGDGTIDSGSLRALHRTPFEILADFERLALVDDRDLWAEYERVMHGKRALVWSRGYRDILGMDPERTDEEVAAAEVGGQPVAVLTAQTWAGVVVARKVNVPWSDARLYPVTALLEGAEIGGLPAVNEVLAGLSLPLALSPLVAGHQDLAGEAWAGWRATTCVRCGVAPRGPGGIICAGCRAAIERGRQVVIIVKELPRCPVRACSVRYPGGENRLCHDHALELAGDAFTRMADLTRQPPGHAVREHQVVLPLLAGPDDGSYAQ